MTYGQPHNQTPLKPAVFHILLALSRGHLHGLGIADSVEATTAGEIRLGPGTLYRSLKEMSAAGLLEHADNGDDDPRRKYYAITEGGAELLRAEAERLARIVDVARERAVLPESNA